MSLATRSLPLVSALAATVLLAGCGQLGDDQASDGRRAVASFYPLAWVTEQVAGDSWTVDNLTQPGQEPHDLALTIAQTAGLESAGLVVLEEGFQPAVDSAAEDSDAVVELRSADHHDESEQEHAEHADDEGDDHSDLDPHFWPDPLLVADFA